MSDLLCWLCNDASANTHAQLANLKPGSELNLAKSPWSKQPVACNAWAQWQLISTSRSWKSSHYIHGCCLSRVGCISTHNIKSSFVHSTCDCEVLHAKVQRLTGTKFSWAWAPLCEFWWRMCQKSMTYAYCWCLCCVTCGFTILSTMSTYALHKLWMIVCKFVQWTSSLNKFNFCHKVLGYPCLNRGSVLQICTPTYSRISPV